MQQGILGDLIFSSASLVLLFVYSIQSSSISVASMSSSVSPMNGTSLTWSQSSFSSAFSSFVGSSSLLGFSSSLLFSTFFLEFSLCLNNEAKHLALCRPESSFLWMRPTATVSRGCRTERSTAFVGRTRIVPRALISKNRKAQVFVPGTDENSIGARTKERHKDASRALLDFSVQKPGETVKKKDPQDNFL